MAFDFPSSPTEGQLFQPPGGPLYVYHAPAWQVDNSYTSTPPGAVMMFPSSTPPAGWLKANGALLSRSTYAALFAMIGTTFGAGDGSTTFALPDLRGEFLRAWDDARGVDASRTFGSAQTDGIETHTHTMSFNTGAQSVDHTHVASGTTGANSVSHTHTFSDASSSTAGVSANHTHTQGDTSYFFVGWKTAGAAGLGTTWSGGQPLHNFSPTAGHSADHSHTVAVSGTTAGVSANHTHTFSDTTTGVSVGHTHLVSGTSAANAGATTETRPRNVALLACIKY